MPMSPLERLFRLEIEFHRRLRTQAPGIGGAGALHTSYALQSGYESLLGAVGTVTARELDQLHARLGLAGDTRDVLAARDAVGELLGLSGLGS